MNHFEVPYAMWCLYYMHTDKFNVICLLKNFLAYNNNEKKAQSFSIAR